MAAHLARVDLSAHGFYATPEITGFGGDRPFSYFTYGAAASEVELDTLSGDFQARSTLPLLVLLAYQVHSYADHCEWRHQDCMKALTCSAQCLHWCCWRHLLACPL